LSKRLDLLVDRSRYDHDDDATAEILTVLKRFARPLLCRIQDRQEQESAIGWVIAKAFSTLREGLHLRRDSTLAFVIAVMRNEAVTIYRTAPRWSLNASLLPDGYDVGDRLAHRRLDEIHVRELLEEFLAEAERDGSAYDVKVAQIVITQYRFGLNVSDACDVLVFSPTEKQRLAEKIAKQRAKPGSRLWRLAEKLLGGPVRSQETRRRSSEGEEEDES
jgi:hypothetical protein